MNFLKKIKWTLFLRHTYCWKCSAKIGKNFVIRNSRIIITLGFYLERYDKEYVDKLENENCMFKLSWKDSYNSITEDGRATIYSYFMSL